MFMEENSIFLHQIEDRLYYLILKKKGLWFI